MYGLRCNQAACLRRDTAAVLPGYSGGNLSAIKALCRLHTWAERDVADDYPYQHILGKVVGVEVGVVAFPHPCRGVFRMDLKSSESFFIACMIRSNARCIFPQSAAV